MPVEKFRIGTPTARRLVMRTIGLGAALLVALVLLLVVWVIGKAFGFEVSLLGSLGITALLTVVLNVVLALFARRRRRF